MLNQLLPTEKSLTYIVGADWCEGPPVPIPNTEVKPFSADGTWLETIWESRTLPDSMKRNPEFFLLRDDARQCFISKDEL